MTIRRNAIKFGVIAAVSLASVLPILKCRGRMNYDDALGVLQGVDFRYRYESSIAFRSWRDNNGYTLLIIACKHNLESAEFLANEYPDFDAITSTGMSALHFAVISGNIEVARMLLERGCNVNQKNFVGETALHFAARDGSQELVLLLIRHGADVESKTRHGDKPLDYAIGNQHAKEVLGSREANGGVRGVSGQVE